MTISPNAEPRSSTPFDGAPCPSQGLDALAVGLDRFDATFDDELDRVASGAGVFRAIRGDYGAGKTFLTRWLAERAKARGLAAAEVQISETDTPPHRYQTIYRRLVEQLATQTARTGGFREVIDSWFFTLEEEVLADGTLSPDDANAVTQATASLMERRLGTVATTAPAFAAVLRRYLEATNAGDSATAEGLLAWLGGQPHVAASIKREAGVKGEVDHDAALSFLSGLLVILRDAGFGGLVLVLDEMETMQRMRADTRDKGLEALRKFIDDLYEGRFPGLYLVVTGTPAFFDGPQGVQRLAPLAQRLHTDFGPDPRFDNPKAVQIRLQAFDLDSLVAVGRRVRDLYAEGADHPDRIRSRVDDTYLTDFAAEVAGELGAKAGVAPRIFVKKLIDGILDRVDLFDDFDPRRNHVLTIDDGELTTAERAARGAESVDDIELDL